jgi:DNA-directed RNA polymerase specialized sigma24 family protein
MRARTWIEPELRDPAAFYAAHPEAVVTAELLERLEPSIRWLVRRYRGPWDGDEVRAALRARIVEAATGYRHLGADGEPVYDFLAQAPSYIVQHAGTLVYSAVRRDRAAANRSRSLDWSSGHGSGAWDTAGEGPGGDPDPLEPLGCEPSDHASGYRELVAAIGRRLSGRARHAFALLLVGHSTGEAARLLGISRQRFHEHMGAIRGATRAALAEMG